MCSTGYNSGMDLACPDAAGNLVFLGIIRDGILTRSMTKLVKEMFSEKRLTFVPTGALKCIIGGGIRLS
jgi:hypothetical protein